MKDLISGSPDTISTPEGDGEFDSSEPLTTEAVESSVAGLQTPPGNAPAAYEADKPSEVTELINVLDEISRGKMQP
jgi:hypothetical protein